MAALARRIVLHAVTIFAVICSTLPAPVAAQSLINEPRYASVLVDAGTGEIVYAQRADSPRYPASITKMMTLYLAFEALESGRLQMDDRVLVSPRAAAQPPSKLGLRAGETLTVRDAIYALAIKSANDIAVALAEKIGGTESRFGALMTLRAQELGMRNTRYVNASGLPDSRQLSSARDIAVLSRALMRDFPQYYATFGTRSWTFRGRQMNNHNRLLHQMAGVDGIKTGFTNASGYNLAASAVRGRRRLIAVVLGGPSGAARDRQTRQLLETGFTLMARRDAGENIQLAANLFENPQSAPVTGTVMQGSAGAQEEDEDAAEGDVIGALARATRASAAAAPVATAALASGSRGTMSPILENGDRAQAAPAARPAAPARTQRAEPARAESRRAPAAAPTRTAAHTERASARATRDEDETPRSRRQAARRDRDEERPTRTASRSTRNARAERDEERPASSRASSRNSRQAAREEREEPRSSRSARRGEREETRTTRQARNERETARTTRQARNAAREADADEAPRSRRNRNTEERTTRTASRNAETREESRGSRSARSARREADEPRSTRQARAERATPARESTRSASRASSGSDATARLNRQGNRSNRTAQRDEAPASRSAGRG